MAAAIGSPLGLVADMFEHAGFAPDGSITNTDNAPEPDRWIGRHPAFHVILEGDPVELITLTGSPSPAMGKVIAVVCDMAAPTDAAELRTWTERTMRGWAKRMKGGKIPTLAAVLETKRTKMRLQSVGRHILAVTWGRR